MKTRDLDAMKAAWKKEQSFEDKRLSEAEIMKFLKGKSGDISRLFRKGLITDMFMKAIIGMSFMGILVLFRTDLHMVLLAAILILMSVWGIFHQRRILGMIPEDGGSDPVVRTSLEGKIRFYYTRFLRSLYVGALSNALLVLSGMLYYFHFKYGEIRAFHWDDYLVFTLVILLSFILGAVVQVRHYGFHVKQLESCLQEIDEEGISRVTIREQAMKKRRVTLAFLLALVFGLLLLAYLIFR